MSLPRRLGIMIFTTSIIGAVTLAFVSYMVSKDAVVVSISQRQLVVAKNLMESVDRLLFERHNDLITVSQSSSVKALVQQSVDPDLRLIASQRLKQLSRLTGAWEQLEVIDRNSTVLASVIDSNIGKPARLNDNDITLLHRSQSGEIAYSDMVYDDTLARFTVIFAVPVRQEDNPAQPILATVLGHLAWSEVQNMLSGVDQSKVLLFNHAGVEIGDQENPDKLLSADFSKHPAIQNAQADRDGTDVHSGISDQAETLISYVNEPGYSTYKGNNWILTIETPSAVALAPANEAVFKRIAALIVITVLVAGISAWLVARAVRPIILMTKSANRLAKGDLSHRFKSASHDEIGQLGAAMNDMADKLQQLYQGLEAKVKVKTIKLALRAEEAEASSAKDEAILSSIGEGLVVINNDDRVIRINNHALRIFGLTLEAILGKRVIDAVTFYGEKGDPLDDKDRPTQTALSNGRPTEGLYQIQRPHGVKVVVSVVTTPVRIKEQTVGAIMVIRDVTKEREVDRMKTEFISLASHQLRTPLSAIKWFSEMLVAGDVGKLSEEQHEFAVNVYDSTQRMIELVNSLLNISRIESGRIIVDPKPTDIDQMVHGIITDLKAKIEHKRQTLVVHVNKDLPKINLDKHLISQVYMNFLTNAIKYTPKGGNITVTVSRRGPDLVSEITDTGYGIPIAQQSHIFQKFFRAENAVKVETDGTGLGLYLAKAIVDSSGGQVWFKSVENKGTSFWFSLPMSGMKAKAGEVTLDA